MRSIAQLKGPSLDPEEAYERYKEWLPFGLRTDAFICDAAIDLGYDPDQLSWKSAGEEKG